MRRRVLTVLEARNLRVRSPEGSLVLDEVTVVVHPAEVVAVVGPHGSGKSSLVRALAGLVSPEAGAISLNGESILNLPPHLRVARGIACALDGRILPGLSIRDNLVIGAGRRRDRSGVARDLERIFQRFPALTQRRPADSLPGGERQMLALGRALLATPKVLLLDEPLAGLAGDAREGVASLIAALKRDEVAVLLTGHDVPGAAQVADRAYGLMNGQIIFGGSAKGLEQAAPFAGIYG